MTTTLREYVESLPDEEKDLIVDGYNEFERNGWIGDDPIRLHAVAFMHEIGAPQTSVTLWMEQLAKEVFHYYTRRYYKVRSLLNELKSIT